jgi:hypothetical protein
VGEKPSDQAGDKAAFEALLGSLLAQHEGKFALMHAGTLAGIFDSMAAAYSSALETFGTDEVYIGRITKEPQVERAPALYHGLILARL